jgi:hypothetical protein
MPLETSRSIGTSVDIVRAMEQIRRMKGGSQPHLMRCANERSSDLYFIVKFKNNPQSRRVLVNDLFCSTLARKLALPVPRVAVVNVRPDTVRFTPALHVEWPSSRVPCESGLQFGCAYVGDARTDFVFDALFDLDYRHILNFQHFIGMLAFDVWTCNTDCRQAVFLRKTADSPDSEIDGINFPMVSKAGFEAFMIDQGACFNSGEWNFPNPAKGINTMLYARPIVYDQITDIDSFEPYLSQIQKTDIDAMRRISANLPGEWFVEGEQDLFDEVLVKLVGRGGHLPDLLLALIKRKREYFKNWKRKLPDFMPPKVPAVTPTAVPAAGL